MQWQEYGEAEFFPISISPPTFPFQMANPAHASIDMCLHGPVQGDESPTLIHLKQRNIG